MLTKFSDRIWYFPGEQENDRPFLYYIRGDKESAVVDAGNSAAHVNLFYQALSDEGLPMPANTIITHWHWDHTFGMHAVLGKTISSARTAAQLRVVQNWKWTDEEMKRREASGEDIAFCNQCIKVEYKDLKEIQVVLPDVIVEKDMELELGGISCRIEHRDAPHSRDSLFVLIPEEKALVLGDATGGDYYTLGGAYDKARLEDVLYYLKSVKPDWILTGHDGPQKLVDELGYLEEELNRLAEPGT